MLSKTDSKFSFLAFSWKNLEGDRSLENLTKRQRQCVELQKKRLKRIIYVWRLKSKTLEGVRGD